jgi:hypothetical protein
MVWFPDAIRKSGAIRFAPIFVFIDCIPIALVPYAACKRVTRIRIVAELVPSPVSSLSFIFFVHSACAPFPLGGLVAVRKPEQLSALKGVTRKERKKETLLPSRLRIQNLERPAIR